MAASDASSPPVCVIVAETGDLIAGLVAEGLTARGSRTLAVSARGLANLAVHLGSASEGESFFVEGRRVGAVVFRVPPMGPLSIASDEHDRAYCDAEARAVWLAAMHRPSVLAFDRLDAAAWFEDARWPQWRRLFGRAGVALGPLRLGSEGSEDYPASEWLLFGSGTTHRSATARVLASIGGARVPSQARVSYFSVRAQIVAATSDVPPSEAVLAAAALLESSGVRLAEILADARGRVVWARAFPSTSSLEVASAIATPIIADIHDHLEAMARAGATTS